ncbi:hypothetical protein KY336_00765 [Candidatus Woesearchaeota archaeon]|nr:hypothetical protein [Candidatus Woesearchaeota archaeon]
MAEDNKLEEFPTQKLEKILDHFEPGCRFMEKLEIGDESARGYFRLPAKPYHVKQAMQYATFSELSHCIEQLTYAAFSHWLEGSKIKNFDIPFLDFVKVMNLGLVQIMRIREGEFLDEIERRNDRPIVCDLKLTKVLGRYGTACVAYVDYFFEDGRARGSLEFGIGLHKAEIDRNHRRNSRRQ